MPFGLGISLTQIIRVSAVMGSEVPLRQKGTYASGNALYYRERIATGEHVDSPSGLGFQGAHSRERVQLGRRQG